MSAVSDPATQPTVLIASRLPAPVRAYLESHCDCRFWDGDLPIPRDALLSRVADIDGLLEVGVRVDEALLDAAPRLRVVSNAAVGYNNLDIEALRHRGVMATHTPGVLDDTVADLIMALILATARRIPELDRYVKQGGWRETDGEELFGVDVHHATLGVIGLGRIGGAVARRAIHGFNMRVLYHNRSRRTDLERQPGVERATLDDLLAESDFVLLMVPLTPQTEGFMGRSEFERMRSSAIFINASRGATVEEDALVHALETGGIRAAGLDVFAAEPLPADHPLTRLPQAVTLPHIGSATRKTRNAMADLAARNLVAALNGRTPPAPIPELRDPAATGRDT